MLRANSQNPCNHVRHFFVKNVHWATENNVGQGHLQIWHQSLSLYKMEPKISGNMPETAPHYCVTALEVQRKAIQRGNDQCRCFLWCCRKYHWLYSISVGEIRCIVIFQLALRRMMRSDSLLFKATGSDFNPVKPEKGHYWLKNVWSPVQPKS